MKFQFEINQKVCINELKRSGRITAIHINTTGTTFRVRYFDDAALKEEYFYDDELSVESKEEIGFKTKLILIEKTIPAPH